MSELGVAEAIGQLRREIGMAMAAGVDEPLQFKLGPVELELQVEVALNAGVKAEAKWIVVSVGADAGGKRTSAHKVKLTLTPLFLGRPDVQILDKTEIK